MPTISRLVIPVFLGALLLLAGCKPTQVSPAMQDRMDHNGGSMGGGY